MRIVCGPAGFQSDVRPADLRVVLYGRTESSTVGSSGAAIVEKIRQHHLTPHLRAWDFLSIALSVTAADLAGHRDRSSDGWTREFDLSIVVADPDFWITQAPILQELLSFLTTDRWRLTFASGAVYPELDSQPQAQKHDSVVLLSGGLDSFIGTLDLVADGRSPFAVSQSVRGDAAKQREMANLIGEGLSHLQMNHNTQVPAPENPPSQRARSVIFFAYGILVATTLSRYQDGGRLPLFVCENGFIALNPPLTASRLGSLSTRTSHPVVLGLLQRLLDAADLRIELKNPYSHRTKGEMLADSPSQEVLRKAAHNTTSCGRFKRYGYQHCGRCVPCLIRRAAFHRWGLEDQTAYYYDDLSRNDSEHAGYDDVRAVAMAVADVEDSGIASWLGVSLSSPIITDRSDLRQVAERGLTELDAFLSSSRVR